MHECFTPSVISEQLSKFTLEQAFCRSTQNELIFTPEDGGEVQSNMLRLAEQFRLRRIQENARFAVLRYHTRVLTLKHMLLQRLRGNFEPSLRVSEIFFHGSRLDLKFSPPFRSRSQLCF